ncbi:hypothetical protein [Moraxella cuniculi]|uniref:hypothetical protein n=1 Tax=Moraxella cuniculi TaxID=34061 RepID=UPI0013018E49|nr:hypothetical protein [Moraxella cuniculi]
MALLQISSHSFVALLNLLIIRQAHTPNSLTIDPITAHDLALSSLMDYYISA